MERRNLNWGVVWAALAVMILVAALMLSGMLNQPSRIVLPDTSTPPDSQQGSDITNESALTVVEITPETVQSAIATLVRPEQYSRTITIQHLWPGGNGSYEVSVAVYGAWSRVDRMMPDNQVCHTITGGEKTYIWYNNERSIFIANVGDVAGDHEQTIPTYEDILLLPVDSIAVADYRLISDVNSIYTETVPDEAGYVMRYWVSVETGLLVAAERLQNDEPVYRMISKSMDTMISPTELFTLPDGTVLFDPQEEVDV